MLLNILQCTDLILRNPNLECLLHQITFEEMNECLRKEGRTYLPKRGVFSNFKMIVVTFLRVIINYKSEYIWVKATQ